MTCQMLLGPVPSNKPIDEALLTIASSTSTTRMNNIGDRGHPCFKPLLILKDDPSQPLTKHEAYKDSRHILIHLIHFGLKLLAAKVLSRKSQSKLSKAFSKSSLNTTPFKFSLRWKSTSLAIAMEL